MLGITWFNLAQNLIQVTASVRRTAFKNFCHLGKEGYCIKLTVQFAEPAVDAVEQRFFSKTSASKTSVGFLDQADFQRVLSTASLKLTNDPPDLHWFVFRQVEIKQLPVCASTERGKKRQKSDCLQNCGLALSICAVE